MRACALVMLSGIVFFIAVGARPARAQGQTPEREIALPEVAGVRFSGFFVGSANYNSRIQMVPEFAGGAPVTSEPGHIDFRFDQFAIGAYKTFASWLSAGASIEIERHAHRHSHGFSYPPIPPPDDPGFGCPGTDTCVEQFGGEAITTEVSLHRFNVTAVVPVGNGIALSVGRFDTPFGYERHDAPLNLTATTSELQRFGRPQSMTGVTVAVQPTPWLDATAWLVNRWENETTEDPPEDNNAAKSVGGRIGFTPIQGTGLLNLGIGGLWGPEQDDNNGNARWLVDADLTWSPIPRWTVAAEVLHGGEGGVSFRRRGLPFGAPAVNDATVTWSALYLVAHVDLIDWLGVSARYGWFDDNDGARTGVAQVLQSFTLAPVVHLSRLVPGLRPMGVAYARTRHPIDWVDLRFEYRLTRSNQTVFADVGPQIPVLAATNKAHQFTFQVVANF
jgi:hypothetical protein